MKIESENKYIAPKSEIIILESDDVITASSELTEKGIPWQDSWNDWTDL